MRNRFLSLSIFARLADRRFLNVAPIEGKWGGVNLYFLVHTRGV